MVNVTTVQNILGECPVWSAKEQKLYWLDLLKPALYAYCPETNQVDHWPMPRYLGGLALREKGGLVIGMQHKIVGFDPQENKFEALTVLEKQTESMRFNDGKCDRAGRFFIGNMKDPSISADEQADCDKIGAGNLFMLDTDLTFRLIESGFTTPNGFTWSLDETLLYVSDTDRKTIFCYDYDAQTGQLSRKRTFVDTSSEDGIPDGACLDSEGHLWSVRYEDSRIVRYRPDGTAVTTIDLPVSKPTSVAFGGKNLETLYVTTASQDLSEAELKKQPFAGNVLALDVGVRGAEVPAFKG